MNGELVMVGMICIVRERERERERGEREHVIVTLSGKEDIWKI